METWASPVAQTIKNLPVTWETWLLSLVGKIPWRKEWLPTPVFWPEEFHGQRNLAGYSPWGCKESDTTEQLSLFMETWRIMVFSGKESKQ